jgi:hypothetical protein
MVTGLSGRSIRSCLLLAATIAASLGCGSEIPSTPPPETPPTLSIPVSLTDAIGAWLEPTAETIARDVNQLGMADVSLVEVDQVAAALCEQGYAPWVVTRWLGEAVAVRSSSLVGPASRLLQLASTTCSRLPTSSEAVTYDFEMYRAFPGKLDVGAGDVGDVPLPTSAVPTATQGAICKLLSEGAGPAMDLILEGMSGRIAASGVLPFLAEVAGNACDLWLPEVWARIDEELND